jgi:hypothetical protein
MINDYDDYSSPWPYPSMGIGTPDGDSNSFDSPPFVDYCAPSPSYSRRSLSPIPFHEDLNSLPYLPRSPLASSSSFVFSPPPLRGMSPGPVASASSSSANPPRRRAPLPLPGALPQSTSSSHPRPRRSNLRSQSNQVPQNPAEEFVREFEISQGWSLTKEHEDELDESERKALEKGEQSEITITQYKRTCKIFLCALQEHNMSLKDFLKKHPVHQSIFVYSLSSAKEKNEKTIFKIKIDPEVISQIKQIVPDLISERQIKQALAEINGPTEECYIYTPPKMPLVEGSDEYYIDEATKNLILNTKKSTKETTIKGTTHKYKVQDALLRINKFFTEARKKTPNFDFKTLLAAERAASKDSRNLIDFPLSRYINFLYDGEHKKSTIRSVLNRGFNIKLKVTQELKKMFHEERLPYPWEQRQYF